MGNQARMGAFGERMHDTPDLRFAEEVSRRLSEGRPVPTQEVARAGAAFVERLWADPRGEGRGCEGLVILLDRASDATARAELVGELISAGPRGEKLLDQMTTSQGRGALREFLDPAEIDQLGNLPRLSLRERLAKVAAMLGEEAAKGGHPDPRPSHDEPDREPAALPERRVPVVGRREADSGGADPEGDPTDNGEGLEAVADPAVLLTDRSQAEEARVRTALQIGKAAIPSLINLARDPAQREMATAALIALGNDSACARDIRAAAIRMEQDPDTRALGELIHRAVEGNSMDDADSRHLSRRAGVDQGWLARSLNHCDPPSILMAGAGREVIVIPMVLRRLAELRSQRVARAALPSSESAVSSI